jgi:transcriptional regulator with XRE-family HTH domain
MIVDAEDVPYRPVDAAWAEELSHNIEQRGLDQPLLVWNGGSKKGEQITIEGKDGKFPATYLIAGQQRRAALKLIRKRSPEKFKEMFPNGIPVIVKGGEMDAFLLMQLRENVTRKDMEVKHILPVMKKLKKEHSMKQREIAKAIGKHESYVSQIFDAEETLGEAEMADLAEDGATVGDARKAAKEVKEKVKAGKDKKVAKDEVVAKTKKKLAEKKASGRVRDERRVSAKALWKRYIALPRGTKLGEKVEILEAVLGYLAGDEAYELPEVLQQDVESEAEAA